MKFLCLDCDEPMKLLGTQGPDEGSLTVTFRCPECGFRVAMLTNPFETQMVRSLGVTVGGRPAAPEPFEHLRTTMAGARADVFEGDPGAASAATSSSGCPFAASLGNDAAHAPAADIAWTPEAEARLERIPSFIRPMARRAIERYAEDKGRPSITDAVMDEARAVFGM
jgi:DNA-directed RNA polymerase subunit RPC12/RpoP